jgi:hypothetical protein
VSAHLHHHALVAHVVLGTVPVLYLQDDTLFTNANRMETVPSFSTDSFFISAALFASGILNKAPWAVASAVVRNPFQLLYTPSRTDLAAVGGTPSGALCPILCPLHFRSYCSRNSGSRSLAVYADPIPESLSSRYQIQLHIPMVF